MPAIRALRTDRPPNRYLAALYKATHTDELRATYTALWEARDATMDIETLLYLDERLIAITSELEARNEPVPA